MKNKKEKQKSDIVEVIESEELEDSCVNDDLRLITLYGEVEEEKCIDIIHAMRIFNHGLEEKNGEKPELEFLISSPGGSASDMFAVYDTMRMVKEKCDIKTRGIGKVMSAGVLLLAAGTKGKRKIGRNCRIMLHSVISGHIGGLHNLENELEEVQWTQKQYIRALAEETDMTQKYIKNLLNRKVNVYLDAQQAVECGIADEVF